MIDEKSLASRSSFCFDDVQIDPQAFKVLKAGSEVQLEPKAFSLLLLLVERRGELVTKDEILDSVWKEANVTENALTRKIAVLRRCLGDDSRQAKYIKTVHTRGYQFIAEVRVQNGASANAHSPNGHQTGIVEAKAEASLTASTAVDNSHIPTLSVSLSPTNQAATSDVASPSHSINPSKRWNWQLAIIGALLGLGLAALLVWKFYLQDALEPRPEIAEIVPVTTSTGLALNPTFSPDGNTLAYSSDQNGGFEIYAKPLAGGGREIQLTADGNQNMEPVWSPDGKFIAYHSAKRGGIWLMPALGGAARQLTEFGCRPAWSPDSATLAFQSESFHDMIQPYASSATLWLVSAQGGAAKQITQAGIPAGGHICPAWSPDGKRIAFLNTDLTSYQIWTVAVESGQAKQLTPPLSGDKADLVWHPDGQSLYFTMGMMLFKLRVVPATGERLGKPVKVADLGFTIFRNPAFSADGKKIAYSAWTANSNVWSAPLSPTCEATGPPIPLTHETASRNTLAAFSPDGRRIAFAAERRGLGYQLWLMDPDGGNQLQLTSDAQAAYSPQWFPDGNRLLFECVREGRQTFSLLTLDSRREKILSDAAGLEFPCLSPDGTQVAFTYAPNGFFNVGTMAAEGGTPKQLTFAQQFTGFPSWSPDGRWLAFQMKQGDEMQIMLMPSEGGIQEQLTFERGDHWPFSWSPDGDKIAFAGSRNGVWNLYWVSRAGKTQRQLTGNTKLNTILRAPNWSPLGNQIVYERVELTGNINLMHLK
jgi:Tol biopolymer transport system component/DNA-binding winged helix-turn-helix (wHTH) protein